MPVQTESTPNPAARKFLPGCAVSASPVSYSRADSAAHPFLREVFAVPGVESVLLGPDFVTVSLSGPGGWPGAPESVAEAVSGAVARHSGRYPGMQHAQACRDLSRSRAGEAAIRIADIVDARIRPAVAADGGDIEFAGFEDGVLSVTMRGACSGCPSAPATLRHGIMNVMRLHAPEVREVRAAA